MKRRQLILAGALALSLAAYSSPAQAGAHVSFGVSVPVPVVPVPVVPVPVPAPAYPVPPPIAYSAPPELVVLPGSDVYVAPGLADDVYFVDGYWWRPYNGHWYRSHYYDRGWGYYSGTPYFYSTVHYDWRSDYHNHSWHGHAWNYEAVPHDRVEANWRTWHSNHYWRDRNPEAWNAGHNANVDDHYRHDNGNHYAYGHDKGGNPHDNGMHEVSRPNGHGPAQGHGNGEKQHGGKDAGHGHNH